MAEKLVFGEKRGDGGGAPPEEDEGRSTRYKR
jgi:hypothetical protein